MKEKTISNIARTLIVFIVMIGVANGISALYSGETYSQNLSDTFDEIIVFEIIGNTSFVDYDITNLTLTIRVSEIAEEDNYNITIKGYKNEEERVVYVHSGGRGSSSKTIYKNVTIPVPYQVTEYVDRIIEKNITIEVPSEPKDKSHAWWEWALLGTATFILLIWVLLKIREIRYNKNIKEVKV
jgi:hypothetical protein